MTPRVSARAREGLSWHLARKDFQLLNWGRLEAGIRRRASLWPSASPAASCCGQAPGTLLQPGEGGLSPPWRGSQGRRETFVCRANCSFTPPLPPKNPKFPKGMKWALCALKHSARRPTMMKSSLEEGMGVPAPAGLFSVPCGFDLFL